MESLLEMNTVKFSVYRFALKLRKVQQKLCLDLLDLKSALFAFNEHGLTGDKNDSLIAVPQMIVVLTSIYEALHEEEPDEVIVALCTDLCLNWLLVRLLLMCKKFLVACFSRVFFFVFPERVRHGSCQRKDTRPLFQDRTFGAMSRATYGKVYPTVQPSQQW